MTENRHAPLGTAAKNAESSTPETLLAVHDLSKTFAVPVLKQLNFELRRGEIHALMGSNGAGKSTLSNIICGVHQPTSGRLSYKGESYQPATIKDAEIAGIRMVMQELNLFPTLSIAENLSFKQLGNGLGIIDSKRLHTRAKKALTLVGLDDLSPDTPVASLGVGKQQLLEIAGVLSEPCDLLILDEPTAALTDPQIELLFTQLRKLRDAGAGIIYISHRMDEICRIADRVSILRDGCLVATENVDQMDPDKIVNLMAGDAEAAEVLHHEKVQRGDHALKIRDFGRKGVFSNIDLDVYQGEVLGIGGLIGSGRTELLRAIFGADVADEGGIYFADDNFQKARRLRSPEQGIAAGIGLVVEDRKSQGLMLPSEIVKNISLASLPALHNALGIMNTQQERTQADAIAKQLAIKCDSLDQSIGQLSGGNQQKALIARWLIKDLPILLFDEPSRGVDARAKARIHALIREQAKQGKAVIVVSSETQELMLVSDRIAVMSNGRLAGEFDPDTLTEEQLLAASFKHYSKTTASQGENNTSENHANA